MGECEIFKKGRDGLEEMREIDECVMDKFGTRDSSENTIAILGGRWPQTAKKEGDKIIVFLCTTPEYKEKT